MAQRSYGPELLRTIQYVGSAQSPYELNWARALAAGLLATDALMILLYAVPPWLGMEPVDVAGMTGALLLPRGGGTTAFWVGLAVQMALSTASVFAYASALFALQRDSTWSTGVVFGGILGCLGPVTALSLLLQRNPFVQEGLVRNPGVLLLELGAVPVLFLLLAHIAYGVIAGALYKHVHAA
jgi:hypothetical protein